MFPNEQIKNGYYQISESVRVNTYECLSISVLLCLYACYVYSQNNQKNKRKEHRAINERGDSAPPSVLVSSPNDL